MAVPTFQEVSCMHPMPPGLIVKHQNGRSRLEVITAIGPKIRLFGFPLARVQLGHRGFIRMQNAALAQQDRQAIDQGLQRNANAPDPFGQRGARKWYLLPSRDLLQAVEGQMIEEFADHHPGEQPDRRHATIDDRRRNRRGRDRLAGTAGVLRADMAMDEEPGGLDIQLFADVLADLDQIRAALATGARSRFMPLFNAWQVLGERLASGAFALAWLGRAQLFYFGLLSAVSVFQLSSNSSRCSAENCSLLLAKRMRL